MQEIISKLATIMRCSALSDCMRGGVFVSYIQEVLKQVIARNPGEPEFHQAVMEVLESLEPLLQVRKDYQKAGILERIVEPDRQIIQGALG